MKLLLIQCRSSSEQDAIHSMTRMKINDTIREIGRVILVGHHGNAIVSGNMTIRFITGEVNDVPEGADIIPADEWREVCASRIRSLLEEPPVYDDLPKIDEWKPEIITNPLATISYYSILLNGW